MDIFVACVLPTQADSSVPYVICKLIRWQHFNVVST